ncbi:hypothetical protein [Actinoalloteichus caeruleus]|uniref:hypothetical protein n=1 Tax=Actinoalloteichus cyanogriseus TaxID=2893586 RepID=UPI003AAE5A04
MDELERTVVQIAEARRLAMPGDVPRGRIYLLLLDNAAEMSLMRTARAKMDMAELFDGLLHRMRDVPVDDEEGRRLKADIKLRSLSRTRRKKIERNYEALVDYVFEDGFALGDEYASCLKILHRYRNAAYHRDTVRADVLGPAVQILFFLCCHLLKSEKDNMRQIGQVPAGIASVLDGNLPKSTLPADLFDTEALANHVADYFLDSLKLDHFGISRALSRHLLARLDALLDNLDEIGEFIPPGVTRQVTLRLVQQAPQGFADVETELPEDFWTRPLSVTEKVIEDWFHEARCLSEIPVATDVLRAFAEIEEVLEVVEEAVDRCIVSIDREAQLRIDEMRGK